MPITLRLLLLPQESVCLRGQNAPNHGWFLNLMRLVQEHLGGDSSLPLGGDLHGTPAPGGNRLLRPYSLSPFYSPCQLTLAAESQGELMPCLRVQKGQPLAIRVSFLDDRFALRLQRYLLETNPLLQPVVLPRLGHDPRFQTAVKGAPQAGATCTLLTLPVSDLHPDVCSLSWKALAQSSPRRALPLRWSTPTLFQRHGKDLAVATPEDLLADWLDTLRTLAEQLPDREPLHALQIMEPARLHWESRNLTPRTIRLKGGVRTAYQGEAVLSWERDAAPEDLIATHALLRFATLVGTGAKTTMGFGQTHLI